MKRITQKLTLTVFSLIAACAISTNAQCIGNLHLLLGNDWGGTLQNVSICDAHGNYIVSGQTLQGGEGKWYNVTVTAGQRYIFTAHNGDYDVDFYFEFYPTSQEGVIDIVSFDPDYGISYYEWGGTMNPPTTFTITTISSPSGGTISGGGTKNCGSTVTVTAVTNPGYKFASWTENGIVVWEQPAYTFTLNADRTLVANFTQCTGSILTSVDANYVIGGTACGSSTTITATPAPGYRFVNWILGGWPVSRSASYNVPVTERNETFVAYFGPISYDNFSTLINDLHPNDLVFWGHEGTHTIVTGTDSDTAPLGEPRAITESLSDIMGVSIKFEHQPEGADWIVHGSPQRDLSDPHNPNTNLKSCGGPFNPPCPNPSPSSYQGTYWNWNDDPYDNLGVQNYFFYLLCEGGSGNNDGINYNLVGIGIANARYIAYRVASVYYTPNLDYHSARCAWIAAAQDLNANWADPVRATWAAVGINDGWPSVPFNVSAVSGNTKVSLMWRSSGAATSYKVKRSATANGPYAITATLTATIPLANLPESYTDTAVVSGTTYYYVISAVNSEGESPNSSEVSATSN